MPIIPAAAVFIVAIMPWFPLPRADAPQEAPASRPTTRAAESKPAGDTFDQVVPGCTARIKMIGLPVVPGATERIFLAETETIWDVYDVFVFGYDVDAGEKELDAITRPSTPYIPPDHGWGHAGYPAMCITLASARNFCLWLSARTGHAYRLPTEAEWEIACRAGAKGRFSFESGALGDYAWFAGNSEETTHPVAKKKPNAFGFYDMHGNVAEWCSTADGGAAVRGGAYRDPEEDLQCTSRKVQDKSWNKTDPQIPKSKWWLSDGPFAGIRVACAVPLK